MGTVTPRIVRDLALAVSDARRMFFDRGVVPTGLVSDTVLASWQRCRASRLDPGERPDPDILRRDVLDTLLDQRRTLVCAAIPVVQAIAAQTDGDPNIVLLTDPAGYVLAVAGNREFAVQARRREVRVGILLSETVRGTNAPGACLHDGKPVIVHGGEHYLAMYAGFACSAAPIHGPQGDIVGAIDITGDARVLQPYPLAFPRMAAELIEQQLFRRTYPLHLLLRFHSRPEYIGALDEGLAVLAEDGSLVAVNRSGLRLLRLRDEQIRGCAFDAVFDARFREICELVRRAVQPVLRLHLQNGSCIYARVEGGDPTPVVASGARAPPREAAQPVSLQQIEADAIRRTIDEEDGNISAAAKRLGVARTTIYRKLKRSSAQVSH